MTYRKAATVSSNAKNRKEMKSVAPKVNFVLLGFGV
jgi:hypothetical protein